MPYSLLHSKTSVKVVRHNKRIKAVENIGPSSVEAHSSKTKGGPRAVLLTLDHFCCGFCHQINNGIPLPIPPPYQAQ
jgi:hypothetical protein